MKDKVGGRVRGGNLYFQRPINNNDGIVSRAGTAHHAAFARRGEAHICFPPKNNAVSAAITEGPVHDSP